MNRTKFLYAIGDAVDPKIKWQLKVLKYVYHIVKWMDNTECKNEGHLQVPLTCKDQFGLCPRCSAFIYNNHYRYYNDLDDGRLMMYTPTLVVRSNIPRMMMMISS